MEIRAATDVMHLLRAHFIAAGLGTALELRLFWRLADEPASARDVAESMGIPLGRCQSWLELLAGLGLLERQGETYAPSPTASAAIMEAYSPETWALLAEEARDVYLAGHDLIHNITRPESVWTAQGLETPHYYALLETDPDRARRFTHMLYEYHQPLAEELGETLHMTGVRRLMDLGGGSGVMSLALLRHHADLTAVVLDLAHVCETGRNIAAETSVADRITYQAADFLRDDLPTGFDMILECDVGIHNVELFRKLRASLNEGGRLVVVDDLVQEGRSPPLSWLSGAFSSSLNNPDSTIPRASRVKGFLAEAGYRVVSEQTLEGGDVVIQAHKQRDEC